MDGCGLLNCDDIFRGTFARISFSPANQPLMYHRSFACMIRPDSWRNAGFVAYALQYLPKVRTLQCYITLEYAMTNKIL